MSPRRSSRARATQPPPSVPTHTNSSTSSVSSGRAERSTRSTHKTTSPRRSNPRSQSLDDGEEPAKRPPRRTRSGHEEIKELPPIMPDDDDDAEEEEEITRCICGQIEYPGLPGPTFELLKQRAKERGGSPSAQEISPEEVGGMFIQCDVCKVWQHGGCVGILNDQSVPDEYFCELCRKDLHKVATAPSGQRYAQYLPLKDNPSMTTSPEPLNRERPTRRANEVKGRSSAEALSHKRRATLNSRDFYDEAEELRKAIEESKKDGAPSVGEGSRKNKRSRSESEEQKVPTKRRRTGSSSTTSPDLDKAPQTTMTSSSDEALAAKALEHNNPKRIRGAAARNHREKELREQKERERQDAATRRKTRVERRRGEDSPPPEYPTHAHSPSIVSSSPTIEPPTTSTAAAAAAGVSNVPNAPPSRSHKRNPANARTTAPKSGRRVGRNQYTKDRDLAPTSTMAGGTGMRSGMQTLDPHAEHHGGGGAGMRTRSRSRSNAREMGESPSRGAGGAGSVNGNNGLSSGGGRGGAAGGANGYADFGARPSRPKHMNPNRTSLNEMKRRVAAILEFVGRAEDDGGGTGKVSGSAGDSDAGSACAGGGALQGPDGVPPTTDGGGGTTVDSLLSASGGTDGSGGNGVEFASLSSGEMLRNLRGRLIRWEDEFGRIGR